MDTMHINKALHDRLLMLATQLHPVYVFVPPIDSPALFILKKNTTTRQLKEVYDVLSADKELLKMCDIRPLRSDCSYKVFAFIKGLLYHPAHFAHFKHDFHSLYAIHWNEVTEFYSSFLDKLDVGEPPILSSSFSGDGFDFVYRYSISFYPVGQKFSHNLFDIFETYPFFEGILPPDYNVLYKTYIRKKPMVYFEDLNDLYPYGIEKDLQTTRFYLMLSNPCCNYYKKVFPYHPVILQKYFSDFYLKGHPIYMSDYMGVIEKMGSNFAKKELLASCYYWNKSIPYIF